MPICGEDDKLKGMLTDRDIVVKGMTENKIRRLPVIDDDKRLCGIVSQADLATHIDEEKVGDLVEAISAAP
jgi:CBS-domain-containing membrane protein